MGHVTEPVRNYDLMNVTMICLGKPEGKHYGGLLRMLEVLFTGRYAAKEVIQILEDEYEFAHAHTMERTVSEMCNLSQGIFEEGMEKGMEKGAFSATLDSLRRLIANAGMSAEQAMNVLEIPASERPRYLAAMN